MREIDYDECIGLKSEKLNTIFRKFRIKVNLRQRRYSIAKVF